MCDTSAAYLSMGQLISMHYKTQDCQEQPFAATAVQHDHVLLPLPKTDLLVFSEGPSQKVLYILAYDNLKSPGQRVVHSGFAG